MVTRGQLDVAGLVGAEVDEYIAVFCLFGGWFLVALRVVIQPTS